MYCTILYAAEYCCIAAHAHLQGDERTHTKASFSWWAWIFIGRVLTSNVLAVCGWRCGLRVRCALHPLRTATVHTGTGALAGVWLKRLNSV